MYNFLILIHYVATLIMTGAIWLAQLSQYPLLAYVGRKNFVRYENQHIKRISDVAWLFIYVELVTGFFLLFVDPLIVPRTIVVVGFLLICLIWGNTWFIQYPIHKKLAHGFDVHLHKELVRTNWVRTISWTLRAFLWTLVIFSLIR